MKTAKVHVLALVVSLTLVAAFAAARPAGAQCIPDPPTGSISTRTCGDAARQAPTEPVATVASVPLTTFAGNPLVAMVSWMVSRPVAPSRVALKPNGRMDGVLWRGRALRRIAW